MRTPAPSVERSGPAASPSSSSRASGSARCRVPSVRQIADYHRAGFTVVAVIGVGASPSCGVHTTLDLRHAFDAMARLSTSTVDRRSVNREVVLASRRAGGGIFIRCLQRRLRRRGLEAPLLEHDLVAEMRGERQRLLDRLPGA
jgi:hypothetical protein